MSGKGMQATGPGLGTRLLKEVAEQKRQIAAWLEASAESRDSFVASKVGEGLLKKYSTEQLALIAAQVWLERQALMTLVGKQDKLISISDAAAFASAAIKAHSKEKWGRGGRARRAESTALKHRLLEEWDAQSHEYASRADFSRIVSQREKIKDRTLYRWITEHERVKA